MAQVLAYIPDLLFGSRVIGALSGAGHDVQLVSELRRVDPGVEVLIADLTADAPQRIEAVRRVRRPEVRLLAFYAHVEADVRSAAQDAGFDLVVPRSRMAREGADLVQRLSAAADRR